MTPWKLLPYLRNLVKDYNYWPSSESDSPLKFAWQDGSLTPAQILKLDAKLRRAANDSPTYQLPSQRDITTQSFTDTFNTLIDGAIANLEAAKDNYGTDETTFPGLETSAEALEFLVQLYGGLKTLTNPTITEVSAAGEPYVSLIISGEWGTGQDLTTIYATSPLIQT
ncbi:MAG: hypothetical protein ACKOX2_12000 [Microcystaceae cyanobacterium]